MQAEIRRILVRCNELWEKIREAQENCRHDFKSDPNDPPGEAWVSVCTKCSKVDLS